MWIILGVHKLRVPNGTMNLARWRLILIGKPSGARILMWRLDFWQICALLDCSKNGVPMARFVLAARNLHDFWHYTQIITTHSN